MAMPVATTRWSPSHLFYVPPGFSEDYVSIVVPTGASVFLDGSSTSLSLSRTSLASTYQTMVLPISDGLHSLTSSQPFGILVHGFTCGASYGYAGEWR
jgi:Na+/H+-dicarboxylate symporter